MAFPEAAGDPPEQADLQHPKGTRRPFPRDPSGSAAGARECEIGSPGEQWRADLRGPYRGRSTEETQGGERRGGYRSSGGRSAARRRGAGGELTVGGEGGGEERRAKRWWWWSGRVGKVGVYKPRRGGVAGAARAEERARRPGPGAAAPPRPHTPRHTTRCGRKQWPPTRRGRTAREAQSGAPPRRARLRADNNSRGRAGSGPGSGHRPSRGQGECAEIRAADRGPARYVWTRLARRRERIGPPLVQPGTSRF